MKKNIKKFIPILAITALMTTSVFAVNANKINKPNLQQQNIKENSIYINGELLEDSHIIKENNKILIPVRAIFEKLGYEIAYNTNTKTISMTNAPHYITFSTTADAYTFSRMAPQPLGNAPIVKEGVTYVPIELFDLIGINIKLDDKNVLYIGEIENNKPKSQIIITKIDEKNNTITVKDDKYSTLGETGEIILNIKDLKIDYTTDDKNLMIGQALEVEYGDDLLQTYNTKHTPKSIKVVDKFSYGLISNIEKDDKGNITVLFDEWESENGITLNIPKDLKINYTTDDKELKEGQFLEVVLGKAMTMSLPPINNPKSVSVLPKLLDNENEQNSDNNLKGNAVIKSVDKENKTVLVQDDKMGEVVLNLYDDVKIEYKNGTGASAYDWLKEGQKLQVEYSPIMTRNLPPINNPIKILVLN